MADEHHKSLAAHTLIHGMSTHRLSAPILLLSFLIPLLFSGCLFSRRDVTGLPKRYKVKTDELLVRSDVKITKDDPLFEELTKLREEIVELLELPPADRPVIVHLFKDEDRYAEYMKKQHPNLPPRRAFFIGSPTELAVFAHWGPSMLEDLRHEYTHGVLHASLQTVPLWLDEGVAEYFETRTLDDERRHPEHSPKLAIAISNGWRPDLQRLEKIDSVSQMQRADYRESWAWIHYLVHDCPDGRALLVDYCESLRNSNTPPRFAEQFYRHVPAAEVRLASYITSSLAGQGPVWALGQDAKSD